MAVVGAGFMGRGLVYQLSRVPGMRAALVVNRTPDRAVAAYRAAGVDAGEVTVADDPDVLRDLVAAGRPAVATSAEVLLEVDVDVIVEATGAMAHGARVILAGLEAGTHVVSLNAELDATLGYLLHARAREQGVVYTIADGDQPGVLLRQVEFVQGLALDVLAAVNCKRNLDIHQDPDDSRAYARRDGTSLLMTTAFGDGTKMQIENTVVANLTGLVPDRRGMHGVATDLDNAARDVLAPLSRTGVVEYTLGGDFGGGVFVIGGTEDPEIVGPYLRYAKLGEGPAYVFFRPYHLMHMEVPMTIAEVLLDGQPVGTPPGPPVAETVAVAKRALEPGEHLDGIGGFTCYGQVDTVEAARGLLPVGLADGARVVRAVARDRPIRLEDVELPNSELLALRRRQDELVGTPGVLAG